MSKEEEHCVIYAHESDFYRRAPGASRGDWVLKMGILYTYRRSLGDRSRLVTQHPTILL